MADGVEEGDLRVLRGIPYAAPPVGAVRLRDPQPTQPWTGVRDASDFGPACPQSTVAVPDGLSQTEETSEDCLTLNVWAPDDGVEGKPVMVWLHGGAFFYGAGSQDIYDGTAFAEQDVVIVTVNYHLGALGFLAHPELGVDVGNDNPGNFGLKDQIVALEWVQANIAAFGGDPDDVTLFGESAGAIGGMAPLDQAVDMVRDLGREGSPDLLACLQDVPADRFVDQVNAAGLLADPQNSFPMPYVDGSFVPEAPAEVYARGEADIPMIAGTNDVALGDAMRTAWVDFARTGDPRINGWHAWEPGGSWMRFDDQYRAMRVSSFRDGRCDDLSEVGFGLLEVHC